MNWFTPTSYMPRISDIDYVQLRADGVRGVIVDLDNTLVGYRSLTPDAQDADWVLQAANHGIRVIMVTNNSTPWAVGVAAQLEIPIVANAHKPLGRGFRRALELLELTRESVIVIGDQLFTDVLGARIFGLRVILVDPLVRHDPLNTLPLRIAERWLLRKFPRTHADLADRTNL